MQYVFSNNRQANVTPDYDKLISLHKERPNKAQQRTETCCVSQVDHGNIQTIQVHAGMELELSTGLDNALQQQWLQTKENKITSRAVAATRVLFGLGSNKLLRTLFLC